MRNEHNLKGIEIYIAAIQNNSPAILSFEMLRPLELRQLSEEKKSAQKAITINYRRTVL